MENVSNGGGDCYAVAGRFILNILWADDIDEYRLVHAMVTGRGPISGVRYGHAWIMKNNDVIDKANGLDLVIDSNVYHLLGNVNTNNSDEYKSYTVRDACDKMLETGNFGPWED